LYAVDDFDADVLHIFLRYLKYAFSYWRMISAI
jgi:hypothetical protein